MSNHTPGPWVVYPGEHPGIDQAKGKSIVVFGENDEYMGILGETYTERQANARLIAAAPEMYEALTDAEFLLRKTGQLAGPMQDSLRRASADIQAIIAKIEGR